MAQKSDSPWNLDSIEQSGRSSPAGGLPSAYARGLRDSAQRLRKLSSQRGADSTPADSASEDVLPGIHPRSVATATQIPGQMRPPSARNMSIELSRPSFARSKSSNEDASKRPKSIQTRLRTRTLDERNQEGPQIIVPVQEIGIMQEPDDDKIARLWAGDSQTQHLIPAHPMFMEHLMRRTRGHMQGTLLYRLDASRDWSKAYCSLNAGSGSLMKEFARDKGGEDKLVLDLRGCQVQAVYDSWLKTPILHLRVKSRSTPYQLQPVDASDFNAWFAALLCWQAVRSVRSLHADSEDAQLTPLSAPAQRDRRKSKEDKVPEKDSSIVKVSKLLLWTGHDSLWPAAGESRLPDTRDGASQASGWSTVSCILHGNGQLKILTTTDINVIATVWLSKLNRSAIQRLCTSVLEKDNTIAIYLQYARAADGSSRLRPLYLSSDIRVVFETWFVLLRAFTLPELYGPVASKDADSLRSPEMLPGLSQGEMPKQLFRVERSLHLSVGEFRRSHTSERPNSRAVADMGIASNPDPLQSEFYVQVLIDGAVKAKTRRRSGLGEIQWFQPLEILDLPPTVSFITIQLRRLRIISNSANGQDTMRNGSGGTNSEEDDNPSRYTEIVTIGELIIPISESVDGTNANRRWPILNELGQSPGDISLQIRLDRDVILLDQEYGVLSDLLHDFSNNVTLQLADTVSPDKLSALSDHLLNIFQASGGADGWLQSLAEDEIDGIRRSGPNRRFQLNARLESSKSRDSLPVYGPHNDREGLLRDFKRATIAEANLLFRGNTLLSKTLDGHMQRLGRDYLEETLGPKMREISNLDQDIEVDPSKISATASPQYNWHQLLEIVQSVWTLIKTSACRCPVELRVIFRHIRACADEKYGGRLKNIPYASVSGFLFLRFFCPAILNPFMFGLVNDFPKPRAQRGFTLIAKSLQGLANQSTFGAKEPWLEPMNNFLNAHRQQFRDFIDDVCSVPSDVQTSSSTASYAAALATFSRLASTSKEGSLSLPYLIDSSRSFAALVDLWLGNYSYNTGDRPLDYELLQFHNACLRLKEQTRDLFKRAERGDKRSSSLIDESTAIANLMLSQPEDFWVDFPVLQQTEATSTGADVAEFSAIEGNDEAAPEISTKLQSSATPPRPLTSEGGRERGPTGDARRFRSHSPSRATSPLRVADGEVAAPVAEDEVGQSEVKAARTAKIAKPAKPAKKGKDKDKDKESQGRGLFGRRRKSEK